MKDGVTDFADGVQAIGQACAAVLSLLNQVTAAKRESILELASPGSHAELTSAGAASAAAPSITEAAKQVETVAAALASSPKANPLHLLECAAAQAIAMALQNTVAADQQLDILAQAVLAKKVALLLGRTSGGATPDRAPA